MTETHLPHQQSRRPDDVGMIKMTGKCYSINNCIFTKLF